MCCYLRNFPPYRMGGLEDNTYIQCCLTEISEQRRDGRHRSFLGLGPGNPRFSYDIAAMDTKHYYWYGQPPCYKDREYTLASRNIANCASLRSIFTTTTIHHPPFRPSTNKRAPLTDHLPNGKSHRQDRQGLRQGPRAEEKDCLFPRFPKLYR